MRRKRDQGARKAKEEKNIREQSPNYTASHRVGSKERYTEIKLKAKRQRVVGTI